MKFEYEYTSQQIFPVYYLGAKQLNSKKSTLKLNELQKFQDEAAEDADEVGVLIGLVPSHDNTAAASDIDFPQGYTFRPRPSI